MPSLQLSLPDLSCQHCVQTVTSALRGAPGLVDSSLDLPTKRLRVNLSEDGALPGIMARLQQAGYPATVLSG